MIDRLPLDQVHRWAEELCGIGIRWDGAGHLIFGLVGDEAFAHSIFYVISVSESCLVIDGYADGYEVPDGKRVEAMMALNDYNLADHAVKAVLKGNRIYLRHVLFVNEPVPEDYVKKAGLVLGMYGIKRAFEKLGPRLRQVMDR